MNELSNFYFCLYAGSASVQWNILVPFPCSFLEMPDQYQIINSLNLNLNFENSLRLGIKKFIGLLTSPPNSEVALKILYNLFNTTSSSEFEYTLLESSACVSLDNLESLLFSKIFTIKERIANELFGDLVFLQLTR